jgi:hypothetical protein
MLKSMPAELVDLLTDLKAREITLEMLNEIKIE